MVQNLFRMIQMCENIKHREIITDKAVRGSIVQTRRRVKDETDMKLWYTNTLTQTSLLIIAKKIKGSQSGQNCSFHPSTRPSLPSAPSHLTSHQIHPTHRLSSFFKCSHSNHKKKSCCDSWWNLWETPAAHTQRAFLFRAKALQLKVKMDKEEAKPINTNKSIFPDWRGSEMQVVLNTTSGINQDEGDAKEARWWFEMWGLKQRWRSERKETSQELHHFI